MLLTEATPPRHSLFSVHLPRVATTGRNLPKHQLRKDNNTAKGRNKSAEMGVIGRATLFKVPDPQNQQKLIEAYRVLEKGQAKDGKPYILQIQTSQLLADPRSKGYTVLARMTFASLDDMKYFDTACPAHGALKKTMLGLLQEPPLVVVERHEESDGLN